jgi:uncharacterized caspase-like protein
VALVIGNSGYKAAPLRNPVNDARAMARVLAETGFAVTLIEDATQAGMRRAIRTFGDELARGGVGLFFYAGHGMQVRGKNFLIPVNADIQREDEVEDQAVDANLVLSKMDTARNTLNVMILDACRNNPFQRSFRSGAQGLAQMDAPSGNADLLCHGAWLGGRRRRRRERPIYQAPAGGDPPAGAAGGAAVQAGAHRRDQGDR